MHACFVALLLLYGLARDGTCMGPRTLQESGRKPLSVVLLIMSVQHA